MKTYLFVALLSVGLGIASGVGMGYTSYRNTMDHFAPSNAENPREDIRQVSPSAPGAVPRVSVSNGEQFEFGKMRRGATMSHVFYLRNIGSAPLRLEKGETTCKCTLSTLDRSEIAPGDAVAVTLEWTAKTESPSFSQSAEIKTNDPERPIIQLRVSGYVEEPLRIVPDSLAYASVAGNESHQRTFRIFGSRAEDNLRLVAWELADKQTSDYFDVAIRDLTAEELAALPQAKSGQQVVVTLKPGYPVRRVSQALRLQVNLTDVPELIVPIEGTIVSDVSIVGRGANFDTQEQLLKLGAVEGRRGGAAELFLLLKGPNRDNIQVEVAEVDPKDVLRVTLGEPRKGEKLTTIPLRIEVPPGAPSVVRLGSEQGRVGKVLLRAPQASIPDIPVYVSFSVN